MHATFSIFQAYIHNVWGIAQELSLWLLIGCLMAGVLHVLVPQHFIKRQLGQPGLGGIAKAAAAGVPMPLCSCGVIPAGIGLYKDGAGRGASVSFLVATPQTAVDSTFVSYSFLGLPFALFKLISSFLMGILAGVLSNRFGGPPIAQTSNPSSSETRPDKMYPSIQAKVQGIWHFGIDVLLRMIWGWVLVGILISAALTTFVPEDYFTNMPFASGFFGLVLALLISLPMYACSTASVPIAASLVHAGLPAGAALVYLMAGPATNVATMGAIHRVFGKRILAIYLGVIIGSSLLLGYLFSFLVDMQAMRIHDHMAHAHGNLLSTIAAVVVLLTFSRFFIDMIIRRKRIA